MDRVIRLARTMAWLRWRLMLNSLRTVRGLGETVARVLVILLGGVLAMAAAVGAGAGVFAGLTSGGSQDRQLVLGVAWGLIGILALMIPLVLGEGRAELAPHRLLQFPLSRTDLFWTEMLGSMLSGVNLVWYPAMAATVVAGLISVRVAPLPLLAAGLLATVSLLAAQQALLMGVQWIAASRRLREVLTVLAIFFFIGLGQIPNLLVHVHVRIQPAAGTVPPVAARVLVGLAESLPPALAVRLAWPEGILDVLIGLLGLALWTGLALVAAWKLYLGGLERRPGGGEAARRARGTGRHGLERLLGILPPDVAGLAAKQLRYALRSISGRLALLMSPVPGLIFGFMGRTGRAALLGLSLHDALFLLLCLMASINVFQLTANRFQFDGGGAALYFVAPVEAAHIFLGLDVGLWLFQSLTGLVMLTTLVIVTGPPAPAVVFSGLLVYLGGQILGFLGGGVLSILVPSPRDMGRAQNRLPLLSSLGMLAVTAVTAAVFGLPALLLLWSHPQAAPPVLLALVLTAAAAYRVALPHLGRLLTSRREQLLAALESRSG